MWCFAAAETASGGASCCLSGHSGVQRTDFLRKKAAGEAEECAGEMRMVAHLAALAAEQLVD